MKFNKEIIIKAHKMTREIRAEYKGVDYRVQFGLCLSYLLNNKECQSMEDERIVELRKMAKDEANYNKIWNEVERMSKEIRGRKFSRNEQLSFNYKSINIVNLAIEILKEEVKTVSKSKTIHTSSKIVKSNEKRLDAETGEWIDTGDDMEYVKGLGWVRADNC